MSSGKLINGRRRKKKMSEFGKGFGKKLVGAVVIGTMTYTFVGLAGSVMSVPVFPDPSYIEPVKLVFAAFFIAIQAAVIGLVGPFFK